MVERGPDVEAGATGEDRHASTPEDVDDRGLGPGLEVGQRGLVGHLEDVEEVVRDPRRWATGSLLVPMSMPR